MNNKRHYQKIVNKRYARAQARGKEDPIEAAWFFIFLTFGMCSGVYFEPYHYIISGSIGAVFGLAVWGLLHTKESG